jgi:hypothetical protein
VMKRKRDMDEIHTPKDPRWTPLIARKIRG